ncbi:hypothetical protein Q5H93_21355 [Hymenobacter sp. ASUV-10]|uniref:Uncharacterized protein n=1 Tax=Hymenobacter aranciens TaxID=3063996 RepID=A0ABT9BGC8_9BACT|nr:hypothetical protein [Hymenobacter sp. ASUV-10]MDO7877306.1 hypothetical protein [Hymenobacter sp. ASUV-10]
MKSILFTLLLAVGVSASSYAQIGELITLAKMAKGPSKGPSKSKEPVKPSDGITSPIHTKYLGKLVFASTAEALALRNEQEAQFSNSFTLGQPIYFRGYMENSLYNIGRVLAPAADIHDLNGALYRVEFYLDGALALATRERLTRRIEETSAAGALSSKEAQDGNDAFQEFLSKNEAKLTPGSHGIKVVMRPVVDLFKQPSAEGEPILTGEFELKVGASAVDPNDTKMCMPAAGMKDPKLEATVMQTFKAKGWPEKPSSVRITSKEWNIVRNELTGAITKRTLVAAISSTLPNGTCRYQNFLFSQAYNGAGYQQSMFLEGAGSDQVIPCGCLK